MSATTTDLRNAASILLRLDGRTDIPESTKIRQAQHLANLAGVRGGYGQILRVAHAVGRGATFGL